MMPPDTLLQTTDHANGSSAPAESPSMLMQALRFTEVDLQANRQRRLGLAQADLLRSRLKGQVIIGLLMASLPISFVMMSLITLGAAGELTAPSDPTAFGLMSVILIIAALSGLVLLGFILRNWRWQLRVLNGGSVLSAAGVVDIELAGRRCWVTVIDDDGHEETFAAPRAAEAAFDGCDRFRVYYLRQPRRIVAAECIDG